MIRWLTDLVGSVAEQRLRDFLLGVGTAAVGALFAAVSLGFGTFAVYVYLRTSNGRVIAALIVCAAYGLLAITIWAIVAARRRARRLRLAAAESAPASWEDFRFAFTVFRRSRYSTGPTGAACRDADGARAFADAASRAGAHRRFRRREKTR